MLAKKMERVMADLGQLLPSWHGGHVTLRKRRANRIKAKRQLSRVKREDSNSEVTYYARHYRQRLQHLANICMLLKKHAFPIVQNTISSQFGRYTHLKHNDRHFYCVYAYIQSNELSMSLQYRAMN